MISSTANTDRRVRFSGLESLTAAESPSSGPLYQKIFHSVSPPTTTIHNRSLTTIPNPGNLIEYKYAIGFYILEGGINLTNCFGSILRMASSYYFYPPALYFVIAAFALYEVWFGIASLEARSKAKKANTAIHSLSEETPPNARAIVSKSAESLKSGYLSRSLQSITGLIGMPLFIAGTIIALYRGIQGKSVTPLHKDSPASSIISVALMAAAGISAVPLYAMLSLATLLKLARSIKLQHSLKQDNTLNAPNLQDAKSFLLSRQRILELSTRLLALSVTTIDFLVFITWSSLQLLSLKSNSPKYWASVAARALNKPHLTMLFCVTATAVINALVKIVIESRFAYLKHQSKNTPSDRSKHDPHFACFNILFLLTSEQPNGPIYQLLAKRLDKHTLNHLKELDLENTDPSVANHALNLISKALNINDSI